MMKFHKDKEQNADYFNSTTKLQLALSNYIQSLSRLIIALEKKNMNISSHTLIDTKQWIISALSNITEIQKILLKKTRIYFLYFKQAPHSENDIDMNLESYIHFDQKIQGILSTSFSPQGLDNTSDPYKHIKNMTLFYNKKEWSSKIIKKGQAPALPWIAANCKPKI